jgi:hypothetical protein
VEPDLLGVTVILDGDCLSRLAAAPEKLLNEKDAIAIRLFKKY